MLVVVALAGILGSAACRPVAPRPLHVGAQTQPAPGANTNPLRVLPISAEAPRATNPSQGATSRRAADAHEAFIGDYCVTCHGQRTATAGLALEGLDLRQVAANAATWEKVIRKLRAGMMPPAGQSRPFREQSDEFAAWLEGQLDRAAAASPNPGRTEALHRLNRAEYRNATRDLLGIDLDVDSLLPADSASYGFDNIAGVLGLSPLLIEKYLSAADRVSRAAVGVTPSAPDFQIIKIPDELPQDEWIEGLPFGTRGGTLISHYFPAAGEYEVRVRLARQTAGQDYDIPRYDVPQELEVSLDGTRLKVFTLAPSTPRAPRAGGAVRTAPMSQERGSAAATAQTAQGISSPQAAAVQEVQEEVEGGGMGATRHLLDANWQVRFVATAGPGKLALAWLNRTPALLETRVEPMRNPMPTGTNMWTPRKGAYISTIELSGPFQRAGSDDTPSRKRILTCRPSRPSAEAACANTILSSLARRAYRRPIVDADLQPLLRAYRQGREAGAFEDGIAFGIQRMLVSPSFLFRVETEPANVAPGRAYRISGLELASRLSFFLWSSIPDDELLKVAETGTLHSPRVLDGQVRRMLADPRANALVENFAGQWLFLRNIPGLAPDPYRDPDFDESLRQALRRETELFVQSIIRDDQSVLTLLTAKYTFLNERLAMHYGIPNVQGSHFRRVSIPADNPRAGILGQGSVLAATSEPNRTSPVKRGKWILENLLGVPPPSPPPDVPPLDEKTANDQAATMRERMTEHRRNPVCASCHALMDPLGFALENFDQAGRWRDVDHGVDSRRSAFVPIDVSGVFPDGQQFAGPAGLRDAIMRRSERFVNTLTEKLMTYAIGRGVEYYDAPAIRAIVREAASADYRFSTIIAGIVKSIPFQQRRAAAGETPAPGIAAR